jgi:hypothetical protein
MSETEFAPAPNPAAVRHASVSLLFRQLTGERIQALHR